ncbi:MAG TPA: hypothetical protein DCZ75_07330 [Geobacter sp.]|nr:hypothetical protein [Geobacter sp.]
MSALSFVFLREAGRVHLFALALIFFGLSSLYSVVTPPFHAPDEPTHFLSMLETVGRKSEAPAVIAWAKKGYFLDIKLDPELTYKFAFDGRYPPLDSGYDNIFSALDMKARSPLTVSIWNLARPFLAVLDLNYCLLAMRLVNGLVVALFYAAALIVSWVLAPAPLEEQGGFPAAAAGASVLLYVPTLPFFAMHVSNYPFMIAGGILSAAIALGVLFGGSRPSWLGALLGFSTFWLMFSGRAGFVFSLLALFLVVAGAVLPTLPCRGNSAASRGRVSALFWLGLVSGWVLSWLIWGMFDLKTVVSGMEEALPAQLALLMRGGWVLLAIPFAFFLFEAAVAGLPSLKVGSGIAKAASFLGLFLFSIGLVGPVFQASHHLRNIETSAPKGPVTTYVKDALIAFWGSQGLAIPDRFLVKYFWIGFGWLENIPRTDAVILLGLPVFAGGIYLWWNAFNSASWPETSRLLTWLGACTACLAALAVGAWSMGINLHGRYLILLYLVYLPVCFSSFLSLMKNSAAMLLDRTATRKWLGESRVVAIMLMVSCLVIHSLSVNSLLTRYLR